MNDYILEMHKFAYERIKDGASYDDVIDHLKSKKFDISATSEPIIRAYGDIFFSPSDGQLGSRTMSFLNNQSHTKHFMAPEAYFRYLGYEEYKSATKNALEAQKASKVAINYAKWALIVTIVVGLAQLITAIWF